MCQRCVFAHLFYKANIVIFLKKTNYLLYEFERYPMFFI